MNYKPDKFRRKFLLHMYNQLFNDINRHIVIVWQCFGTLVGAIALLALTEKDLLSIDIAVSLIIIICAWLIANLYDASYWYNRKLAIITNIEKEFLFYDDLRKIHYYFGRHRPNNKMITHFKIQYALSLGTGIVIITYHIFKQIIANFHFSLSLLDLDFAKLSPYVIIAVSYILLRWLKNHRDRSYLEFIENSPGLDIETLGVTYGLGHGFKSEL